MDYKKLWNLVSLLASKTEAGEIAWEPTPMFNAFQVSFQNFSVMISERDDDCEPFISEYAISLYNKEGKMIEQATSHVFRELSQTADRTMRELYQSARHIAFGVDKALDEIIAELDLPF